MKINHKEYGVIDITLKDGFVYLDKKEIGEYNKVAGIGYHIVLNKKDGTIQDTMCDTQRDIRDLVENFINYYI